MHLMGIFNELANLSASTQPAQPAAKPVVKKNSHTAAPHRDTTVSRNQQQSPITPVIDEDRVERIRKAVRQLGKEAATYRFTKAEKEELANIVFGYRQKGIRTTENEISRIAINFLLQDYHERGDQSVLELVLQALNR